MNNFRTKANRHTYRSKFNHLSNVTKKVNKKVSQRGGIKL